MRDFARISMTIWNDDDFRDLSPQAQHLYFVLMSSPSLSYAGVDDWRPARIAARARGWTQSDVIRSARELSMARFIVVDQDSEEILVRSFVRNDPIMKQPNLATAMARAYMVVGSSALKGVIVHELSRLKKEQPKLSGWKSEEAGAVLKKRTIDPSDDPCGHPSVEGQVDPSVDPSGEGESKGAIDPSDDPSIDPCPTTATATYNPQPSTGGYGGRERYEGSAARTEAPSEIPPAWIADPRRARCAAHAAIDSPPPCRGCATAREAAEAARAAKDAEKVSVAAERRAIIDACDLCDPNGKTDGPRGLITCPHDEAELSALLTVEETAATEPTSNASESAPALRRWRRQWANRTTLLDGETTLPAIEHDDNEPDHDTWEE